MASLTLLFVSFILVGLASPVAHAQLGPIVISGTIPCSTGTSVITSTTPVFANATVQLVCGNNTISSAVTNSNGVFAMVLNPLLTLLSTLLNTCKLVVRTPLSSCNSTLPSTGTLQSSLQLSSGGLLDGIISGGLLDGIIGGGLLDGIIGAILNLNPTIFNLII